MEEKVNDKTKELSSLFDGMSTQEIIAVLANFTGFFISISVKDKKNYDKAIEEFAVNIKKVIENIQNKDTEQ